MDRVLTVQNKCTVMVVCMEQRNVPNERPGMEPVYFTTPEAFRGWLEMHHETATEIIVGFYKKKSGVPGITWAEAVDEALCFGWIDSVGRRIDDQRHTVRFTPRKPRSVWSDRNIRRVEDLTAQGRMRPAGLRAFEARSEERSRVYSHEQDNVEFSEEFAQRLKGNDAAWTFFESQPPSYQRAATHWVMSAKRETTRERRLSQLIEDSAAGQTVPPLTRKK